MSEVRVNTDYQAGTVVLDRRWSIWRRRICCARFGLFSVAVSFTCLSRGDAANRAVHRWFEALQRLRKNVEALLTINIIMV